MKYITFLGIIEDGGRYIFSKAWGGMAGVKKAVAQINAAGLKADGSFAQHCHGTFRDPSRTPRMSIAHLVWNAMLVCVCAGGEGGVY